MATTEASSGMRLTIERVFAVPQERLFQAWTDPKFLSRWFSPAANFTTPLAEVDLRKGGKYRITMKSPEGRSSTASGAYKDVKAPDRLVFTWAWEGEDKEETLVTVEFKSKNGSTLMLFSQETFVDKEIRDGHEKGWLGSFENLERILI